MTCAYWKAQTLRIGIHYQVRAGQTRSCSCYFEIWAQGGISVWWSLNYACLLSARQTEEWRNRPSQGPLGKRLPWGVILLIMNIDFSYWTGQRGRTGGKEEERRREVNVQYVHPCRHNGYFLFTTLERLCYIHVYFLIILIGSHFASYKLVTCLTHSLVHPCTHVWLDLSSSFCLLFFKEFCANC